MKIKLRIFQKLYPQSTKDVKSSYNVACNSLGIYPFFKENHQIKMQAKSSLRDIFAGDNLQKRKEQLIKDIRKAGFWGIGDLIAKRLSKLETSNDFLKIYENIYDFITANIDKRETFLRKSRNINFDNFLGNKVLRERMDASFYHIKSAFYRFFTPDTKNPEIKEIENAIKQMGVKEVRLGDNIEDAQNIFKAIKIAHENKDSLPSAIFVPVIPDKLISGVGGFFERYSRNNSVIVYAPSRRIKLIRQINEKRLKKLESRSSFAMLSPELQNIARLFLFNQKFSTNKPYGFMLHEIGHANQRIYLPQMSLNELSQKDVATIRNLTDYCYHDDVLAEAYAELYAKMRANGVEALSKDELNLWKRLNSGYFTSYEKKLIRQIRKQ